ncbi:MAG: hypothetical protein ACYDA8_08360 [Deferrisomatales bacterium]
MTRPGWAARPATAVYLDCDDVKAATDRLGLRAGHEFCPLLPATGSGAAAGRPAPG